jgi:hypothetical protein
VSNAWVTCPEVWDNSSKGLLIPHVVLSLRSLGLKRHLTMVALQEGPVSHQLVGEVTAHQGDDG